MTDPADLTTERANERRGRRVPRGGAREALVGTVLDLVDEVTLDDLTAFVTVSRLTERTGLSAGAVYSAFRAEADAGTASSVPRSVARHALVGRPFDSELVEVQSALLADAVERAGVRPGEVFPADVAHLLASVLVESARSAEYTRSSLALAGCRRDPEVAERMRRDYSIWEGAYARLAEDLLDRSEREPVGGLKVDDVARIVVAAMDGAAQRVRCDPSLGTEFVANLLLGVWAGVTRPVGEEDDLLERRVSHPLVIDLEPDEQVAVAAAVRRVHDTAGWPAVSLRKVAQLSGLPVGRVVRAYGNRDHFAPLVWEDLLAGILRRVSSHRAEPWERAEAFLLDLADVACANRRLTASLLAVRLEAGPDADRTDRIVDRLTGAVVGIMESDPDALGPFGPAATLLVESVLVRAACSDIRAEELARTVLAHVH